MKPNSRQITQRSAEPINPKGHNKAKARPSRNIRPTRRIGMEKNKYWASNVQNVNTQANYVKPDDTAKTTTKETTLHNTYSTGQITGNRAHMVYKKDDIAKTTTKETTLYDSSTSGNVGHQPSGGGYRTANHKLDTTMRQITSTEYIGNAEGDSRGAYKIIDVKAPNTTRQFTTTEYIGSAGAGGNFKQKSYTNMYNSTVRSQRQDISKGRKPTTVGPKKINGKNMIHMTTKHTN